jgi:hypothetical protein
LIKISCVITKENRNLPYLSEQDVVSFQPGLASKLNQLSCCKNRRGSSSCNKRHESQVSLLKNLENIPLTELPKSHDLNKSYNDEIGRYEKNGYCGKTRISPDESDFISEIDEHKVTNGNGDLDGKNYSEDVRSVSENVIAKVYGYHKFDENKHTKKFLSMAGVATSPMEQPNGFEDNSSLSETHFGNGKSIKQNDRENSSDNESQKTIVSFKSIEDIQKCQGLAKGEKQPRDHFDIQIEEKTSGHEKETLADIITKRQLVGNRGWNALSRTLWECNSGQNEKKASNYIKLWQKMIAKYLKVGFFLLSTLFTNQQTEFILF